MCSIFFSTEKYDIKDLDDINYYNKFRGPDDTTTLNFETNAYPEVPNMSGGWSEKKGYISIIHNLLTITGNFTQQPFVKDQIVCYIMVKCIIINHLEILNQMESV